MKYYIRGKSSLTLSQNDFISSGGQARTFGKNNLAYKIYNDKSDMIPEGKIRELKAITHPNIIVPQDIVLDKDNNKCGYTMKWIKNSFPLCKLFTNGFRTRNNIDDIIILEIVDKIRCIIVHAHKNNILIVDGNEFNYLISDRSYTEVFAIDTDSYQTESYPADAILPTIKDYQSDKFTELTDWFSFAIIACQLFIGIHPFKGKHPNYTGSELEKRMIDNISIFNKKTILPPTARDFNNIPKNYYDWFIALFENGVRAKAPDETGAFTVTFTKIHKLSISNINIYELKECDCNILYHRYNLGVEIIKTKNSIYVDKMKYHLNYADEEIILTSKKMIPIACRIFQETFIYRTLTKYTNCIDMQIKCSDMMIINNTVYLKNGGKLLEIDFNDDGPNIIPTTKNSWPIMQNSSILFGNVIYQDILGEPYLFIPLPNGSSKCFNVSAKGLKGYRIVDAKYDNHVCCIIAFKNNQYDKVILRFNENHDKYDCRTIENITYMELNFTIKDNGVVVMINDEEHIEIFRNIPFDPDIVEMDQVRLPLPLKLSHDGNNILYYKDNKLNRMTLSK